MAATRELLAEGGVRELTVEAVAARSGVANTTIYRRWRGKHELALAVLSEMVSTVVATRDLGDTRAELVAFVRELFQELLFPAGLLPAAPQRPSARRRARRAGGDGRVAGARHEPSLTVFR